MNRNGDSTPGRSAHRTARAILLVAGLAAACGSGPDERDAMALMSDLSARLEAGRDASGFAELWTADGDFHQLSTGARWEGREGVDSAMARVFERRNPGARIRLDTDRIRVTDEGLAVVDATIRQDDSVVERMTLILVPRDGEWRVAGARTGRVVSH